MEGSIIKQLAPRSLTLFFTGLGLFLFSIIFPLSRILFWQAQYSNYHTCAGRNMSFGQSCMYDGQLHSYEEWKRDYENRYQADSKQEQQHILIGTTLALAASALCFLFCLPLTFSFERLRKRRRLFSGATHPPKRVLRLSTVPLRLHDLSLGSKDLRSDY